MELGKQTLVSLLLAATLSVTMKAQETIVTGMIRDTRNVPIVGATICQVNTANCTAADRNGIFHLMLGKDKEMNLKVECLGFNPVEVVIDESTIFPLNISLTPLYITGDTYGDESYSGRNDRVVVRSSMTLDAVFSDFKEFTPLLGSYNTEVMDYFSVAGPELGASFSGVYFGLGMGLGYGYSDKYDTITINLNNTAYKLSLGFDMVSTDRLRITPLVSLRWLRYRLLNYSGERKISLASYLDERDLDLRFNQAIAVAGLNIEYLMYSQVFGQGDYWSVGLFGGYATKINPSPWIFSRGNRVMTDNSINLKPLTIGFSISFYIIAD